MSTLLVLLSLVLPVLLQEESQEPKEGLIRVVGNTIVDTDDLEGAAVDELADLRRRGGRRADADDAAFQMESYYRDQGFPSAEVTYKVEKFALRYEVTFYVSEGPLCTIESLSFTGNQHFEAEQMESQLESLFLGFLGAGEQVYVESDIEGLPARLAFLYYNEGFLDVQVEPAVIEWSTDRTRADISVHIEEGIQYRIAGFSFLGNEALTVERLENALEPQRGNPYFARRAYEIAARVEEVYAEEGRVRTHAEARPSFAGEPGEVNLEIHIEEGPLMYVGTISVAGNEDTRESFIRSRLEFETGEVCSLEDERESFRSLFGTGLFEQVDFEFDDQGEQRNITVLVKEAPSVELFLAAGYGSYEGARGKAGLIERNLFGTGRLGRLEATASQVGESALIGYTDPWFFGTKYNLDIAVDYRRREEPSFTLKEYGLSVFQKRTFTPDFAALGGYSLRSSRTSDVDVAVQDPRLVEDVVIGSISLELIHDTRDDLFNPHTGHRASINLQYASEVFGGDLNFFRLVSDLTLVQELHEDLVLAMHYRTGFILPVGGTSVIPLQERFYNGGERTVRAFEQSLLGPLDPFDNPLGGEVLNVGNLELRYRLTGPFQVAVFGDIGNVGLTFHDYFHDLRPGVGLGFRYLLPIGAIRTDVGFNPNTRGNEEIVEVHISVGMAF